MTSDKFNRRDVLRTGGAAGLGLWAASNGLPVFAQDAPAPELDLPQGAAGKLTVIHRTEYFEAAQNLFRDTVTKFAAANNTELDISTDGERLIITPLREGSTRKRKLEKAQARTLKRHAETFRKLAK